MAKLSKRAQVEALGWTFKSVPRFWAAGEVWHDPATGLKSPESWDTTVAGVIAKARAIELLFDTSSGRKAAAVRALVADLVVVLGASTNAG